MSCAAVVLAAGAGRRFGGHKLLAPLDGRPLLQHVLDTVAQAGLAPVVVVVGPDGDRLSAAIEWRGEHVVANPDPARGLSSSLRLGVAAIAATAAAAGAERLLILLGDQPRLHADQVRLVVSQPVDETRPIVVPRYDDGRLGNPVLLERAAWALVEGLHGDRGLSQLFEFAPHLVRHVAVPGRNPDVDTPRDLARVSRAAAPVRSSRTAGADRSTP